MPTRNVVLTDHQAALLDRLVKEGRYQNASEAVREGLRLVEEHEDDVRHLKNRLELARRDLAEGRIADGSGPDAINRAFSGARSKIRHDAAE